MMRSTIRVVRNVREPCQPAELPFSLDRFDAAT